MSDGLYLAETTLREFPLKIHSQIIVAHLKNLHVRTLVLISVIFLIAQDSPDLQ